MIKLIKVNKWFNRFKKNQIHVINNTSFELGDKGLVSLLGESGSGKTTLLNAIGGLDNIDNGSIIINDKKLSKFSYFKDKTRTLTIGYIFQNYNLIENMSVYDNIAISLRMIGIKNKKDIEQRVNYVLEKTGMYRYRKRPASALSGGQRQRVAIARAIVKNPDVIIADEPTGNLDSQNTIEIMNIIKTISQEKLVLLVTHEKPLAMFYSDKIIKLEDGLVVGVEDNTHNDELDYRLDNKIYLKDIKNKTTLKEKDINIDVYNDSDSSIDIKLVVKNGNIYIEADKKIEVVDGSSNIKLADEHYKKITKDDYIKNKFDLNKLRYDKKLKYSSIYNPITMLAKGLSIVINYKFIKKLLLLGFVVSGMFILYGISNIFGVTNFSDKDFLETNKKYLLYSTTKGNISGISKLESINNGGHMVIANNPTLNFNPHTITQFENSAASFTGVIAKASMVNSSDIIYGKMPGAGEVVVDKTMMEKSEGSFNSVKLIGVDNYKKLVGQKIKSIELVNGKEYTISGVVDLDSPCFYINDNEYDRFLYDTLPNVNNAYGYSDSVELKEGRLPGDYETLIPIDRKEFVKLNTLLDERIEGQKLKVVGYYFSAYGSNKLIISDNMMHRVMFSNFKKFYVYNPNKEEIKTKLKDAGIDVLDTYSESRNKYIKDREDKVKTSIIIAAVFLVISFVEIFLMIRASFMSRIKEVGILRAVGVKKFDIYKMFMGEILVITTFASVPGIFIMAAFIRQIRTISLMKDQYMLNNRIILMAIILVYALNLVIGLFPLFRVMLATPHKILSRNDVD